MQADPQPRYPPARVRHGKRFNPSPWPGGQGNALDEYFTAPFTFTLQITGPLPPTSTLLNVPTTDSLTLITTPFSSSLSSTPTLTPLGISTDTTTTSSTSLTTSVSSTPLTSATTTSISTSAPATSTTTSGSITGAATTNITAAPALSPGAIAGIVITVLLVFLAAIVIVLKKKSLNNMLKSRSWSVRRSPSVSFLWVEPGDKSNLTPYPRANGTRVKPRASVPFVPMTFAAPGNQHTTSTTALISPVPSEAQVPEDTASPPPPNSSTPAQEVLQAPESAVVLLTFIPALPDELPIVARETIRILAVYDDGWAYCSNARGETGMVPLECLARRGLPRGVGRHVRDSSLGPFPETLVGDS